MDDLEELDWMRGGVLDERSTCSTCHVGCSFITSEYFVSL